MERQGVPFQAHNKDGIISIPSYGDVFLFPKVSVTAHIDIKVAEAAPLSAQ